MLKTPVLRLKATSGGPDLLYSDSSLTKLAFNDSSIYEKKNDGF